MYGIEEKREEVLSFIKEVPASQMNQRPTPASWSIIEITEHLFLMEQLISYQIGKAFEEGSPKETSEKPIHKTTNRDYKVDAPEAVQPKGQMKNGQEAIDALAKSREALLFLIHNKDEETLKKYAFPHPAFGDLNIKQWVEFIGWHEIRHLEQMKEVHKKTS
ncbi:DinB family protein [Halobacillus sp. A5]|uniref:DinB family protein n=1 Tax=Halobacillus sp. A5 TaxID=2880263 RepID=UPI0020A65FDB|nr:DinB family protein [Halobacillus sp. A5]MCP3029141.1 DinB family protein [Halobacillus sp. A5]